MLAAAGSPLVAGSAASTMPSQLIRVERAFFLKGKALAAGVIVEVPLHVAAEAVTCGKASFAEKPAPVVEEAIAPPAARKPRGK